MLGNIIDLRNIIVITIIFSIFLLYFVHIVKLKGINGKYISDFFTAFLLLIKMKNVLIKNIAITLFKVLINSMVFFYSFYSLGYNIDLYTIFFINSIVSIISMVPITVNGVGLREGVSIYLYSFFGLSAELIISAWIVSYLVIYTTSIITVLIQKLVRFKADSCQEFFFI